MSKYTITISTTVYKDVEVEAVNEDSAVDIAQGILDELVDSLPNDWEASHQYVDVSILDLVGGLHSSVNTTYSSETI